MFEPALWTDAVITIAITLGLFGPLLCAAWLYYGTRNLVPARAVISPKNDPDRQDTGA
jgi:hypothetical protein